MNKIDISKITKEDINYLQLLSQQFPSIADACKEIINLTAIINLPKGTEYFLTDLHGEYEAFMHVLKNASGVIKQKVTEIFGNTLRTSEKVDMCTLIYYPEQKLKIIKQQEKELHEWYRITLNRLIEVCRVVSSKYTRSKVRKALPPDFSYIIQELLHESDQMPNKLDYFNGIISTIISIGRADDFIVEMCNLIQRLTIDTLHIVGDVYDRGPGPHIIMDTLCNYHHVDIQWGNHDILWMGAASGNLACIANVVRIQLRYSNLEVLENGYGINILPLATFAMDTYANDPCDSFQTKNAQGIPYKEKTLKLMAQMHKAISIIQFKVEGQIVLRRSEFDMHSRNLLDKMDLKKGTVKINNKEYPLNDCFFPTIDPNNPFQLTDEETELIDKLKESFTNSEKLERHIHCLYSQGSLYLAVNNNLMYHASIPMNKGGKFRSIKINAQLYKGKELFDKVDQIAREAYFGRENSEEKYFAEDYMWYLWCGPNSPLFDKDKMATFERYFVNDKTVHTEVKGAYFTEINNEEVCNMIFEEFQLNPELSHIINGHVPVKTTKGEKPTRANGKLLVIDGGFSKAYQPETGIAGYTLIYNSYGIQLVQHEPFESTQKAIEEGKDIKSTRFLVESTTTRIKVRDTNVGKQLQLQIDRLHQLLAVYRHGLIKELK